MKQQFKYIKSIMIYGYCIVHPLWDMPVDAHMYRRTYLQCLTGNIGSNNWDRAWLMKAATWTRKMK